MPLNRITLDTQGMINISFPADLGKISRAKDITYAKYDKTRKVWVVPPQYLLAAITTFPGFAVDDDIGAIINRYTSNDIAAKNKAISTVFGLNINIVGGRKLFAHQKEGVYSILKQKRLILSHEMGLGKTTTALVAGKLSGLPIYVICPRSLFTLWQREADLLGIPITKLISWVKITEAPTEDFYLIMDEAQALQTFKRAGTQKAIALADKARYVVCVTGTPCKNGRPANMFGLLCAIHHPESFKKPVYDKLYRGTSNLPTLFKATHDYVLFKKKEDCIDLPEKIRTLRTVELTPEATITYNRAFDGFRERWRGRVERNEIISSNEKLVIFTQLRHAASWAKLYAAEQMAQELNDNKTQAVFFVAFTDTADALTKSLGRFATVGKITGEVSQKERQRVIDDFQNNKSRFIVATFGAGGLGITLHSSHHVVLIDRAWTPGDCIQAEDRLHRIGQKNTVLVDWLQCNGTDQSIDDLLLRKQHNISTILTGDSSELPLDFDIRSNVDDIFNEVFK